MSNAIVAKEPLYGSRQILGIVLEVICIPHNRIKEKISRQMAIVAQEVLAQ